MSSIDRDEWYAPECEDDTNSPVELGLIQHAGSWHTPDEVREFARVLLEMADTAEEAGYSGCGCFPKNGHTRPCLLASAS